MSALDDDIATLANRQHGVFSTSQAADAGAGRGARRHRLASRRWLPVTPTVMALPGAPPTREQRLFVGLLANGPGTAVSHRAAATLHGLPGFGESWFEYLRPRRRHQPQAVGIVHETIRLEEADVRTVDGFRVTTMARTLLDLAAVIHPRRLERAMDNALLAGLVAVVALTEVLRRLGGRGRAGTIAFRLALEERATGYVPPESELEARFLRLLARAGLPIPVRQQSLGDDRVIGRVDFVYPDRRLIIELDGRRWHDAHLVWESDRVRDNALVAAGWRVVRITWHQLTRQQPETVRLLRRLLAVPAGSSVALATAQPA